MDRPLRLHHYGVLAVRGPDARRFLNGQLSQDVLTLDGGTVRLAGLHTPQGRVIAVLRLVAWAEDTVLCLLPRAAIAEVQALLARYLLRAKAALRDESDGWRIEGLDAEDPADTGLGSPGPAAATGAACRVGDALVWRHAPDGRCLRLTPIAASDADAPPSAAQATTDATALAAWRLADIAAGLPEVHPATRGAFVAQMLNLDVLGGISFTKGCYTGQEVIARAHYRGRVKRRLQRFEAMLPAGAGLPAAGDALRLGDGRAAQVVEAVPRTDGRVEFLAVAPFAASAGAAAGATDATDAAGDAPADAAPRLEATPLPLPYALPD